MNRIANKPLQSSMVIGKEEVGVVIHISKSGNFINLRYIILYDIIRQRGR